MNTRHILVTGASSGIGRAICEKLLPLSAQLTGLARDFGKFSPEDKRFPPAPIDLANLDALPDQLKRLSAGLPQPPDTLICNAGSGAFGHIEQFSYSQIRALTDLNFTSHAFIARSFLPAMKQAGRGDIIFIGSEAALRGGRKGSLYCAAKFALRGFAQSLREECAGAGVRISLINPGMVKTPFFDKLNFAPGDEPDNYLLPGDVAEAVALILQSRPECVFDEINLSPRKHVVRTKP